MSMFDSLADTAKRLLNEYGQDVTVSRASAAYDAATRKVGSADSKVQVLKATLEPHRGQRMAGSLTSKYDRIAYASPIPVSGTPFDPMVGDKLNDNGELWVIGDGGVSIERRQGVSILYVLGLNRA